MASRAIVRPSSLLLSLCAFVVATGCGGTATTDAGKVGRVSAPVVNGVYDIDHPAPLGDVDEAVISISWFDSTGSGFNCSGSLIAPRVVMTARHCVSSCEGNQIDPYACTGDVAIANFQFSTGPNTGAAGATWAATAIKVVHDSATTIYAHDLALIELDQPIGSRVVPIRLNAPPVAGEAVRAVGYGLTNDPAKLNNSGNPFRFRRDGLTILELGPDGSQGVASDELLLGESICDGDSGGPILDATTGAVVGSVSRGGNGTGATGFQGCLDGNGQTAINVYTRVDKFAALINQALADVGETATLEGSAQPSDAGAETGDDAGAETGDDAGADAGAEAGEDAAATAAPVTTTKSSSSCAVDRAGAPSASLAPLVLVGLAALLARRRRG